MLQYLGNLFLIMASVTPTFSQYQIINKNLTFLFSDSTLFTEQDLGLWFESSDTVRRPGMSKATLSIQSLTKDVIGVEQRAIFFALLNPQPNGAGFAGMKRWINETEFQDSNLTGDPAVTLRARAQGLSNWKVILYHKMQNVDPYVTYEGFFEMPTNRTAFSEVEINIDSFLPYFRGRQVSEAGKLDVTKIAGIGVQAYGGVYVEHKQSGPGTLELEKLSIRL